MSVVAAPLHNIWSFTAPTVGVGFTVMLKVLGVPVQLLAVGVTMMFEVMGVVPLLVAVKDVMLPFPLAPKPIFTLSFVQENVVPVTEPPKFMAVVPASLHNVWLAMLFTVGVGFTVIVNEFGVPTQLFAEGVTVTVAVVEEELLFMALNAPMFPLPDAARPIETLSLVHANVLPVTAPAKFIGVVTAALHKVWLATLSTVGVGFTLISNVFCGPVQPSAVGVTVMVDVIGMEPGFVAVKGVTLSVPLAAKPMPVLLFVHVNVVPNTGPEKFTAEVEAPLHNVWSVMLSTAGVGFTIIANEAAVPVQLFAVGITDIVAVTGTVPLFTALNAAMFPFPDAANPMDVLSFVQPKVVFNTFPLKLTADVDAPLHKVWSPILSTVGVGFTVMVNVEGVPAQLLADGETVIVAVTGAIPLLMALNAGISPVPDAASPMLGVLFTQSYVVLATDPPKLMAVVCTPLHKVWFDMLSTVLVGLTVMVNVVGVPVQLLAVGVTVIVAVTGEELVLMALKGKMFPFPLAAKPMLGAILVQAYDVPGTEPEKFMAVVAAPLHSV